MVHLNLLVFLLLCLWPAVPVLAQTSESTAPVSTVAARGATLSGRVVDSAGNPIADVSVGVTELRRGTMTDAAGQYAIRSLPLGTYHLSFQRLGFTPIVRRFVLSATANTLDATLAESMLELPGAQVSATANATTALTSPQPISVLEGGALREAQNSTLAGTLEQLPGMRSWSTGAGIGKPMIRGLRSDRVVTAANGLRLDNQQWGDEHGSQIETADIERVEVIRGPASVLYGSDALGGVVNVIARELPTAFGRSPFVGGRVHGGFGSVNRSGEGGLALEGASQGFGFRGSFTGRHSDDVNTPTGELFNSGSETMTGSGSIGLRGTKGSVDLSFVHRAEKIQIHEDPAEDPTATPNQKIDDDLGRLTAIVPIGGAARLELNIGVEQNRRREFESKDDPTVVLGLLARTFGGAARLHHPPVGPFEGLVEFSLRSSRFTKFGEESLIPRSTGNDAALFAFEQAETGPWRFAFGARYDHRLLEVEDDVDLAVTAQKRSWDAATGNFGALYRVAEPVALVANVGRGFRAPSNFDLYSNGVHEGTVAFEKGDPGLKVETSLNADVALRVQASRVKFEVGGFVNQIQDYIYTRPTGTFDLDSGFEIFQTVQGDARLVGFEVSGEAHPARHVHLNLSSDFVRGDNTDADQPLPWIPPVRALYGVRFESDSLGLLQDVYFGVRGESIAQQNRLDPYDSTVPSYTLAHFEAGMSLPVGGRSVLFDLGIQNLFDTAHRDFLSRFKTYALSPGRNVTLRLTARF